MWGRGSQWENKPQYKSKGDTCNPFNNEEGSREVCLIETIYSPGFSNKEKSKINKLPPC